MAKERILITGASGFIGSFLVEEALRQGFEVFAAVRATSSKRYLQDARIRFVELDYGDTEAMARLFLEHRFTYIVHAAGVTKCLDKDDFRRVNFRNTTNMLSALELSGMEPRKFVFLSSLSVMGAIRERRPFGEILPSDEPQPNTLYGKSKLLAEKAVESSRHLPWIILRPTGVYGRRERDYMMMVNSIRQGVDFKAGFRRQDITFIHVLDVVKAVFLSIKSDVEKEKFFLSDGKVYTSTDFSNAIKRQLGVRRVLRFTSPLWLLWIITAVMDALSRLTHQPTALNRDKFHILKQRNWRCSIKEAEEKLRFHADYDLESGVREMLSSSETH